MKNGLKNAANEDQKTAGEIMSGIQVCMLNTVTRDGEIASRPMYAQEIDGEGNLWFFTSTKQPFVAELSENPRINVTFEDANKNRFLSASGAASTVKDRSKMEELWNPGLAAWYKDGLESPELLLLKVAIDSLEFWDSPNSTAVKIVGFVKSLVSDEEFRPGRHEKVNLRH